MVRPLTVVAYEVQSTRDHRCIHRGISSSSIRTRMGKKRGRHMQQVQVVQRRPSRSRAAEVEQSTARVGRTAEGRMNRGRFVSSECRLLGSAQRIKEQARKRMECPSLRSVDHDGVMGKECRGAGAGTAKCNGRGCGLCLTSGRQSFALPARLRNSFDAFIKTLATSCMKD